MPDMGLLRSENDAVEHSVRRLGVMNFGESELIGLLRGDLLLLLLVCGLDVDIGATACC